MRQGNFGRLTMALENIIEYEVRTTGSDPVGSAFNNYENKYCAGCGAPMSDHEDDVTVNTVCQNPRTDGKCYCSRCGMVLVGGESCNACQPIKGGDRIWLKVQ